jgi:hypothetical protein
MSSAEEEKQFMTKDFCSPANDSSIFPEHNEPITAAEVTPIIKCFKNNNKKKYHCVDNPCLPQGEFSTL